MEAYELQLADIMSRGMIPVVRRRDILRVRVMTADEKSNLEHGAPDMLAVTPSGQQLVLKRSDIRTKYTYLSGKKISLAGWKSSTTYMIVRGDNTKAFAMMVPTNCTAKVGTKTANTSGRSNADYIVALATPDGEVDQDTIGIIPSAMFKKMYTIPNNEVIQRNKGKGHKLFGKGPGGDDERQGGMQNLTYGQDRQAYNQGQYNTVAPQSQRIPRQTRPASSPIDFAGELNMDTTLDFGDSDMYSQQTPQSRPVDTSGMRLNRQSAQENLGRNSGAANALRRQAQQRYQVQNPQQQAPQSTEISYEYMATGRLVSQDGQLVGFLVQHKSGQQRKLTLNQVMSLCSKKKVSNIMLVRQDNGRFSLRGNNIQIGSLPSYPV